MGGYAAAALAALQIGGGLLSASQQKKAGKSAKDYYDFLATEEDKTAALTLRRGSQEITSIQDQGSLEDKNYRRQVALLRGTQQATLAANGIAGSATAEDIERDTFRNETIDEDAIRHNADMQSYQASLAATDKATALRSQAKSYRLAGKNALQGGNINAGASLLNTASSVGFNIYNSRR